MTGQSDNQDEWSDMNMRPALHDDALRPLHLDHVEHVLNCYNIFLMLTSTH
jgi:hypothetical protein